MATMTAAQQVEIDEVWKGYKADPTNKEYRNLLVENYLPLVKYNGERIWARLPEGVELDDLISYAVFCLKKKREAFEMSHVVRLEHYNVQLVRGAVRSSL